MDQKTTKSSSLINIKSNPPGFDVFARQAAEHQAYYDLNAYPHWAFQVWRTEVHGPLPRVMPLTQMIVDRFARWMFGKPITFKFTSDESIDKELQLIWNTNDMNSKLVSLATMGGIEGAVVLKFFIQDKKPRIQTLKASTKVRFYYDEHDSTKLVMVRVQYPYFNYKENSWMWYREEWTDELYVTYKDMKVERGSLNITNPIEFSGQALYKVFDENPSIVWEIKSSVKNRFGIIPIVLIKNYEIGTEYGRPDLGKTCRILDRINMAYHLMDKSNQLDIDPIKAFIDLDLADGESTDTPLQPGGSLELKTRAPDEEANEDKVPQGKIQILEPQGKMREHLRNYANDLKEIIFDSTGAVFPRQESITNKGSLTQSVLIQMFAPMLEVVGEKRKTYGEGGICKFLKTMAIGLSNYGYEGFKGKYNDTPIHDEKLNINLTWFTQFERTEDEKFAEFDRIDRETVGGYIPVEEAVDRIANIEEITLTEENRNECIERVEEFIELQRTQPGNGNEGGNDKGRGNDPGGNEDGNASKSRGKQDGKQRGQQGKQKQQGRGTNVKDAS